MRVCCSACGQVYYLRVGHDCKPLPHATSSNKRRSASSNRNAKWRAAHPEQYRKIMRDYMRRYRAGKPRVTQV
jgi:hypothetical protein